MLSWVLLNAFYPAMILLAVAIIALIVFLADYIPRLQHKHDLDWPDTEATITSYDGTQYFRNCPPLCAFNFRYTVAGEYYSGTVLLSHSTDTTNEDPEKMIGQTFLVLYNPAKPEKWLMVRGAQIGSFDVFDANDSI